MVGVSTHLGKAGHKWGRDTNTSPSSSATTSAHVSGRVRFVLEAALFHAFGYSARICRLSFGESNPQ